MFVPIQRAAVLTQVQLIRIMALLVEAPGDVRLEKIVDEPSSLNVRVL
jgi:hypothetical protein